MKLQVQASRVREVLKKGSEKHETASKGNESKRGSRKGCKKHESAIKSNESKRGIGEGKQGT